MGQDRDSDTGRFVTSAPKKQILEYMENAAPDPVVTASEIADQFDISHVTANRRLKELHDEGAVERRKVGARAVVWWVAE